VKKHIIGLINPTLAHSMSKYFLGIEIEINHHCNLACDYCPNSNSKRISQGNMSIENFLIILNQLKDINYNGRISYHFYNEPLLHPQLEEFIFLSKKILPNTRSEIFTNGILLNEAKFHSLRLAGTDKFTVTQHQGISNLAFNQTLQKLNEEEKKIIKYYDHSELTYSNRGGLVNYGKKLTEPSKRTCLIPTCSLVVTVNGSIVACYEDYKEKNIMGNIFQEHIKDIWNKPKYQQFREDLKQGLRYKYEVCKTCNNLKVVQ
jgi:radical SAM protein with 4Fe4S-binding SPASM domain